MNFLCLKKLPLTRIPSIISNSRMLSNKLFCFDIDGVLLRGHAKICEGSKALELLKRCDIPYMFLTNGSPCTEKERAAQLTKTLGVECPDDVMIMAQTPFRELVDEHEKHFLVVNQGECKNIISKSGFKNVSTIEDIKEAFPSLDSSDRSKIVLNDKRPNNSFKKIDGIILMEDPLNWEVSFQIILDVLITNGDLNKENYDYFTSMKTNDPLPIYVGCTDYFWVTEAPWPRMAHGTFLHSLETLYKKYTGKELSYKAVYGKPNLKTYHYIKKMIQEKYGKSSSTVYFIGDNPLTDIYGANIFKDYLTRTKSDMKVESILVKTGVYSDGQLNHDTLNTFLEYLHKDTVKDSRFLKPSHIFDDAFQAVQYFLKE